MSQTRVVEIEDRHGPEQDSLGDQMLQKLGEMILKGYDPSIAYLDY